MYSALKNKTAQQHIDSIARDVRLLKRFTEFAQRMSKPKPPVKVLFVSISKPLDRDHLLKSQRAVELMERCSARAEWKTKYFQDQIALGLIPR